VNKLRPFVALRIISGIIIGEIKIEITLPEVIARTINSGGYGRAKLFKIPAIKTITVSGPKPKNPKKITMNGSRYKGFNQDTWLSKKFNPPTTFSAKSV